MRWRPARVAWSTSRPSPDYGAGSWGFESLTARHYHRSSADGDEAAGCRQAAGLRPNCDHVGGHSRATATIMAAAGFPLPLSADLEDLASAVTLVHADHHPTGSGSSLRNWAEITSHTCGEASKVGRPQRSRRPDSAPDNRFYHRPPGWARCHRPGPGEPAGRELSGAGSPLPEIGPLASRPIPQGGVARVSSKWAPLRLHAPLNLDLDEGAPRAVSGSPGQPSLRRDRRWPHSPKEAGSRLSHSRTYGTTGLVTWEPETAALDASKLAGLTAG